MSRINGKALVFLFLLVSSISSSVHAQGPGSATTISSGDEVSGVITLDNLLQSYEFNASANDTVFLSINTLDDNGYGLFTDVIDPAGNEVVDSIIIGKRARRFVAPSAGVYRITLGSNFSANLGEYTLRLVIVGSNASHEITSNSITEEDMPIGDIDTFSFEARAGEYAVFAFDSVTTDVRDYFFELYGPSGLLPDELLDHISSSKIDNYPLPEAGRYTLVVWGNRGDEQGDYSVSLALTSDSDLARIDKLLPSGSDDVVSTTSSSEIGIYGFDASIGESVMISMGTDVTYLEMALYSPDGSFLGEQEGLYNEIKAFNLEQEGRYLLIVKSQSTSFDRDGGSGPYTLYFQQAPGDSDFSISHQNTVHSSLEKGALDSYGFTATQGDSVVFTFDDSPYKSYMWAKIFAPDGSPLDAAASGGKIESVNLPQSGQYKMIVRFDLLLSGDYSVTMEHDSESLRALNPDSKQAFGSCGFGQGDTGFVGNPINLAYGFKAQTETDFSEGALRFTRYYRSNSDWTNDSLGEYWRHNFYRNLHFFFAPNGGPGMMEITDGSGAVGLFQFQDGQWVSQDPDKQVKFEAILDGENIVEFVYTTARETREIYNIDEQLTRIEYLGGQALDLSYEDGRLKMVSDENGRQLVFAYDSEGRVDTLTTPNGDFQYKYDSNNNLELVTQPDNDTRQYHYEDTNFPHALTGITDENKKRYATFTYDDQGRATSSEHSGGADNFTVAYNDDGTVTTTNPLGKETIYHFEAIQGIKRVVLVDGQPTSLCEAANQEYIYDDKGLLYQTKDWKGYVTQYDRNDRGLVETLTEALGTDDERVTTYTYIDEYRLPDIVTLGNTQTDTNYDDAGRVKAVTVTDLETGKSRTVTSEYYPDTSNEAGRVIQGRTKSIDGPRTDISDITTFEYDDQLRLVKTINALNHEVEIKAFDGANRPTLIEDQNNVQTFLDYDSEGRLKLSVNAYGTDDAASTVYEYYPNDLVKKITLPNDSFVEYGYDDARRLRTIEDSLGNKTIYDLDADGNRKLIEYKDKEGALTFTHTQIFDELSRLRNTIAGNGDTESRDYDTNNNLTKITDGTPQQTEFIFDALNRLEKSIDPDTFETETGFDEHDRVTSVKNARKHDTLYDFNGFGDLLTEDSPETGLTTNTYDEAGNLKTQLDARGVWVEMTYDALNRLRTITYPTQPELNTIFTYDSGENCGYGIGRLCSVTYQGGSTEYRYDIHGRVEAVIESRDTLTFTTQYSYDSAGVPTGMVYPSGRSTRFDFNANAQISAVYASINGVETQLASDLIYLPFGPLDSMTYGNGIKLDNTFNQAYQLDHRSIGTVMNNAYGYDAVGNITSINAKTYDYDNLYRLDYESNGTDVFEYLYDSIGSRKQKTENGVLTEYNYEADSQLIESITGGDTQAVDYDERGNMTLSGNLIMSYNDANRLAHVQNGEITANYRYDHRGLRFLKQISGSGGSSSGSEELAQQAAEKRAEGDALQNRADQYQAQVEGLESQIVEPPNDTTQARINAKLKRQIFYIKKRVTLAQNQANEAYAEADVLQEQADSATGGSESATTIYYVYGLSGKILGEYDQDGNVIREYIHLNGEPLAQIDVSGNTDSLYYLHTDHLATPRVATDVNGEEVWRWESDAFGNGEPSGNILVNLRFPGQYLDFESGLHYNWHRFYYAVFGRYISSDPIGLAGGLNTYSYVSNNPNRFTDFRGLDCAKKGITGEWKSAPFPQLSNVRNVEGKILPISETEIRLLPPSITRVVHRLEADAQIQWCVQCTDGSTGDVWSLRGSTFKFTVGMDVPIHVAILPALQKYVTARNGAELTNSLLLDPARSPFMDQVNDVANMMFNESTATGFCRSFPRPGEGGGC